MTTKACGDLKDIRIREKVLSRFGINNSDLVTAEQVHGSRVAVVDKEHKGKKIDAADGLITKEAGLPVAIFTADCLPVFVADKRKRIAGIIHSGWRGIAGGIISRTIEVLKKEFNSAVNDIFVFAGPHIQECCYFIGDELKKEFNIKEDIKNLSLSGIVHKQLKSLGVSKISISKECSCHEEDLFFSYRRNKTSQRMMSLVMMK
ncbi:MAG: peptidoglycan editing factor PgeF [Endomicrobiales bacterium]|nr:peptidoglycan editing factor PgeF [Endomicrobiales bacterium]